MPDVLLCHTPCRKAPLEAGTYLPAIDHAKPSNGCRCVLLVLHNEAVDTVVNDFRNRTSPVGNNRCAAGHRLNHYQAERLGPLDWKKECSCAGEELLFASVIYLADQLD